MRVLLNNIRNNAILYISGLLALISCFVVRPDAEYAGYINFRILSILFCLMLIVASLVRIGTFDLLTGKLLKNIRSGRSISLLLIILSFFMSMFLTNDVTLVTLVPFAILVLKVMGDRRNLMYTLILMTVAANLGSMQTPIGNPQNLYLYETYKIPLPDFLLLMLPYSLLSLLLIIAMTFILIKNNGKAEAPQKEVPALPKSRLIILIALFILSLLTVVGVVHYLIVLIITAAVILIFDRKAFKNVDYGLLLTFVFFFVLIGNLGRIPAIIDALSSTVDSHPIPAAILSSQIISNVPAAMLLSAFTDKGRDLVIGTNLGGLGTIIASMASLITYKFHGALKREDELKGKRSGNYLLAFTLVNVTALAVLYVTTLFLPLLLPS